MNDEDRLVSQLMGVVLVGGGVGRVASEVCWPGSASLYCTVSPTIPDP